MSTGSSIKEFWSTARSAAAGGTLRKITLSKPRYQDAELPRNRYATLVTVGGNDRLQITHRYADREEHTNHLLGTGLSQLENALGENYGNADLFTESEQLSLQLSRKGKALFQRKSLHPRARQKAEKSHDREKNYLIPASRPYLHDLGITNAAGEVVRDGKRKFKQIQKFVEVIDAMLRERELPADARIVDMGSGSGYLTFALYDHLANTLGLDVIVTGVELRPKLVEKCRAIAKDHNFGRLQFVTGYIDDFRPERLDMLIALHACDTATDDALFKGIRAGAQMLVVAPCCQKQVRRDTIVPDKLKPFLGNGIHLERQAAMLTDSIRALLLEAEGYKTKLFEFVPLEHTAKNVMITAVRGRRRRGALEEVRTLRETFGVERHYLEELLKDG